MVMALKKHLKEREKWKPVVVARLKEHPRRDFIPTQLGKRFSSRSLTYNPGLPRIVLIMTRMPRDTCRLRNISEHVCISLFVPIHKQTCLSLTINSQQKPRKYIKSECSFPRLAPLAYPHNSYTDDNSTLEKPNSTRQLMTNEEIISPLSPTWTRG